MTVVIMGQMSLDNSVEKSENIQHTTKVMPKVIIKGQVTNIIN